MKTYTKVLLITINLLFLGTQSNYGAVTNILLSNNSISEHNSSPSLIGTISVNWIITLSSPTYSLVSGIGDTDNGSFFISGNQLFINESADYNSKPSYSIRIRADDTGDLISGNIFEKAFTINVLDVNDPPVVTNISNTDVDEGLPAGSLVATFTTTDPDVGDSFTYTLIDGAPEFSIPVGTNQLRTAVIFDAETTNSYDIRIRTEDSGGLITYNIYTITINGVNEDPTDITISVESVDEGLPAATLVGTFTTIDPDVGDVFTYTLINGGSNFSIPAGTNQLVTDVVFDAEVLDSYLIRVRSEDSGGKRITKNFVITINNIDESPTDIGLLPQEVAENALINTQVGTLTTVDPDGDVSFVYSLVSGVGGEDNASFNILADKLRTSEVFDYETKDSYSVLIRSTSGLLYVDKSFNITVTNENDLPEISGLIIDGVFEIDEILTADYIFSDPDGDVEGTSEFQWRIADNSVGSGSADIPLANEATFALETVYGGRWISVDVIPHDELELPGIEVSSSWYYINTVPEFTILTAENILHPGAFARGEIVQANTDFYSDLEGDQEGTHEYQWYRSNTGIGLGTPISEAIDPNYEIQPQDKFISIGAIPVAITGSSPGIEARSIWYEIGDIPTATISGDDTICTGNAGVVSVELTGENPPWSIIYSIDGGTPIEIPGITTTPYLLSSVELGTYELLEVKDEKFDYGTVLGTASISTYPEVSAALTEAEYSICAGNNGLHEIPFALTGTAPWSITYTRDGNGATSLENILDAAAGIEIQSDDLGTYEITLVKDANNCAATGTGSTVVLVKTSPIASISGDSTKCSYESTSLLVELEGNGPWTFFYTVDGEDETSVFVNQNVNSFVYELPAGRVGTYQITQVSDQDREGCADAGLASVTDYQTPNATFSDGPEVCEGSPTKLGLNLIGTAPWIVNYQKAGQTATSDTIKVFEAQELSVNGVGTYILLDASDKHCDGSASGSIDIIEAPPVNIDITNTTQYYQDLSAPLTVSPLGGNFDDSDDDRPFDFSGGEWTFIPAIAYLFAGSPFDIVYSYKDPGSQCIGKDSVKIFILESVAEIQVDNDSVGTRYCSNQDTILIYGKNIDDIMGSFSISGGQGLVNLGNNTAGLLPSILQSGSYTVTYSVTIDGTLYQPKKDFTFENIDGDFAWDNECFVGQSLVNFADNSTPSQGVDIIGYRWQIAVGDTVFTADTSQFSYAFDALNSYPIQFIVRSESCRDTVERDLVLKPTIPIYDDPYTQNFTDGASFWSKGTSLNEGPVSWTYGMPEGVIFEDNPDQRSWYTNIIDDRAKENSYIISPCFDFSDSKRPMIQMDIWQQFAGGETDGANLQYTRDNGVNWTTVGTIGDGIGWYNSNNIAGSPGINWKVGWSSDNGSAWQTSIHDLNSLIGEEMPVRFRINYGTPAFSFANPRDGIAIDDILIGERTRRVLIEHFTNMSDTVSKRANEELNTLAEEFGMDVLDIQYHAAYPGVDTFYTLDPVSTVSREYYYNIPDIPYAIIDGGGNGNQDFLINYKTGTIDPLSLKKAVLNANVFNINLAVSEANNALAVDVDVTALADLGILNLTVHVVVIESVITDVTSIFDEVEFRNVARAMLPDAIGTNIYNKEWIKGTTEHIALDYNYNNIFDKNEVRVVVFVQDESTKVVYQAEIADPNNPTSILPVLGDSPISLKLYPNPATDRTIIDFNEQIGSNSEIQIVDYTGRLVLREKLFYGQHTKVLDLNGLESGVYIVRLTENGNLTGLSKLVILSRR